MIFDKFFKHGRGTKANKQNPVKPSPPVKPKTRPERRRQLVYVGVWSDRLQEWMTIHGKLPANFQQPPFPPAAGTATCYEARTVEPLS